MTAADEAAARWLDDAGPPPDRSALGPGGRRELARALKQRGYAALHSDLGLAERSLQALRTLSDVTPSDRELAALADWMAGAVAVARGRTAEAVEHLDTAHAGFVACGRAADAAATQVPKLAALAMLGRYDEALACGERTRAQLVAAGDEATAGRVEINLGNLLVHQRRYAEAAPWLRSAAVRLARAGDRRTSVLADLGLGTALNERFEFDEAALIFDRAAARARAHGLTMLQGVIDNNRGMVELRRGRYAPALKLLESALAEFERHGPPQQLAEVRADLAGAYLALNLLPEALRLYEQSIETGRRSNAPMEEAWATGQRGVALARLGRTAEAAAAFDAALTLFAVHDNPVGAARVRLHAADLALHDGDAARALAEAETAEAALAGAGTRSWQLESRLLAAEALAVLGRDADAWQRFQSVLADAQGVPEVEARCQTGLALLLERRGDLAGARMRLEDALRRYETQQAALQGDEFRTAYVADKQAAHDRLFALALVETDPARRDAQLFRCMERSRARALQLAVGSAERPRGDAERWRAQLHALQQQWQHAVASGDAARASATLAEIRAVEAEVLETQRRLQASADTVAPQALAALPTLERLQRALPPWAAWVEYAWLGSRLFALVVRGPRCEWVELPVQDVESRVEQLRFQIDALRYGAPAMGRHAEQMRARAQTHLEALHRQVWAPLATLVDGVGQVIVAPHRVLHYVPFAALHDGQCAVFERHAVSQVPSAALWLERSTAMLAAPQRALAVGVGGPQLPHVAAEIACVAEVLGPGVTALVNAEATLPALRRALPGAELLHLACHGQFRADSPYFSSLHLADGALTLRDAAALPLAGVSVTLSACETGLSRAAPGDELLGLVRGFLMAGAPTVLATLWTVDDASCAALMRQYYGALAAGRRPAQALREAQAAVRECWPHPYHWAAYVLHGQA